MRWSLGIASLLLGLVLTGCGAAERGRADATHGQDPVDGEQHSFVGIPAPPTAGVDLDGEPFKLSDYRGKVVLLSFWAEWCPPCVAMLRHERVLAKRMQGRPFALLGVNADDNAGKIKAYMTKANLPWRCFWDGNPPRGSIHKTWDVSTLPSFFVIDGQGVVRANPTSQKSLDEIATRIDTEVAKLVRELETKE